MKPLSGSSNARNDATASVKNLQTQAISHKHPWKIKFGGDCCELTAQISAVITVNLSENSSENKLW